MSYMSISISIFSLIVSAFNAWWYHQLQNRNNKLQEQSNLLQEKYNDLVRQQNKIASGNLEIQLRTSIRDTGKYLDSIAIQIENDPENVMLQKVYQGAVDDHLNAYEEACASYLKGEIDKDWFRNLYFAEIRQLVEEEPHRKTYSEAQTKYDCTMKVYNEWYHNVKVS